uniref:Uncharacterized protein n=1 Tax=Romanomermis culicivorax TaxID=13658 RepID=A0A915JJ76_ROMCU
MLGAVFGGARDADFIIIVNPDRIYLKPDDDIDCFSFICGHQKRKPLFPQPVQFFVVRMIDQNVLTRMYWLIISQNGRAQNTLVMPRAILASYV